MKGWWPFPGSELGSGASEAIDLFARNLTPDYPGPYSDAQRTALETAWPAGEVQPQKALRAVLSRDEQPSSPAGGARGASCHE
jgi:hypothetical protein